MANGNPLARLLQGQLALQPSPGRSAQVAQLMQRTAQQPAFSTSPVQSASIAARPIIAALLARREQNAQQQQSQSQRQALLRAMGIPEESVNVGLTDPRTGQTPNREVARMLSPQQEQMSALVQALSPQQTQAVAGSLIQQQVSPQQGRQAAVTDIGKINQDVLAGNITQETGGFLKQAARNEDRRSISQAETALRKEFNNVASGFASGLQSLNNARNLLELEDNPVGAQAALTAFVRAIDNSVVRPSEQQMYQNIFGLAEGLANRINQLMGQGAFTEESKRDIMSAVDSLAQSSEEYLRSNVSFYQGLAKDAGLKPTNVTGSFDSLLKQAQRDGNGGSQSKPKSEKSPTEDEPVLRIQ